MQFSENWLREMVSLKLTTGEIAERLTLAGLEVEAVETISMLSNKIVVGEITAIEAHPNADRLRVCQVTIGKPKVLTIVCGAPNAAVGMKTPVALIGATLANGTAIRKSELRGVASSGMLCSMAELGLEESAEGLMALSAKAKPGTTMNDYLAMKDNIISLDLTPNRGDCFSIRGIARELSALTGARLKAQAIKKIPAKIKDKPKISLKAKKACPRYAGRIIRGINNRATTPDWLLERLRRSGLRGISPAVDVSNYVMLELGQPMHGFDLGKLNGAIQVRMSTRGESMTLLDGKKIKIEADTLLITDSKKPLALAGIMGGLDSSVTEDTQDILLESAYFDADAIAGKARSYGLHTDSSHRFERGVDPTLQQTAIERATALLLGIVGGQAGPVLLQESRPHIPKRPSVNLRKQRLDVYLGMSCSSAKVSSILQRLGMKLRKTKQGWSVKAPAYRFDIQFEVDLIEEVARVIGYDNIPTRPPKIAMSMPELSESDLPDSRFAQLLVDRGYQEIITYSFVDESILKAFGVAQHAISLANPIASDMAVMRTSLWPGLVQALSYNLNRQQERVRLFEIGRCFEQQKGKISQEIYIAGAICGNQYPQQWASKPRAVDFFDAKGDVEALVTQSSHQERYHFDADSHPALQDGQTARIYCKNRPMGWIGAINPALQGKLGLDTAVFLFEMALLPLKSAKLPVFQPISRFPSIRRDLALVLPENTPARSILGCVRQSAGELLVNLELFDEYRGEGIDSGRKSLALSLTFRDSSRTLKEDTVDALVDKVLSELRKMYEAHLRE
ncbi:MAG TPA: phenylalanine--tRNA ligase subunit beta [Acidiferrobacteraceae bacterium]|nr:phenylalanine--tRNA ligase subunit beta [Acidiferrobacteraceae bacterium]HEX19778.1 phenylalanine--tRNA ligase subunit beta [Acidiferrobacteraceae bacterium]